MGGRKKHHIVYKTTNLTNGKVYIGVHATNKIDDGYLGSGCIFQKALNKYGRDNFSREILFDFDTPEEAYLKEKELVNIDFINKDCNYNCKVGGEQGAYSEDSKTNRMTLGDDHYRRVSMSRIGEENFHQRLIDIQNANKRSGWIVKLGKKWDISKVAARSFIKRWYKDYKPLEIPPLYCQCGKKIKRRIRDCDEQSCMECRNITQRSSDFYSLSKNELQDLVNKFSKNQIRKRYKIHARNLSKAILLHNIDVPDRTKHKQQIFEDFDIEEIKRMKEDLTVSCIAEKFEVSRGVVYRRFRELGI